MHGKVRVCDLKKHHVSQWLEEKSKPWKDERRKVWCRWGPSSRRIAITALISALNWAVEEGYISKNPVAGMKRPAQVSRSAMSVISDAQHALFLERAAKRKKKGFHDLLVAMYESGARPGEVAGIEAKDYNPQLGAWVIEATGDRVIGRNKMAYRGKRRVIFLRPKLKEMVERLNQEHPTGPIFPAQNGRAYGGQAIVKRLAEYRDIINEAHKKAGNPEPFTPEITAYSYRHRFVQDWLLAGKSAAMLADLLGTSLSMLTRHYSHLGDRADAMRAELMKFKREGEV
jgi:integrase/recombinase XerD